MKKNIYALLLSGIMIAMCATGCGDKPSSTVVVDEIPTKEAVTTKVIKPGVEFNASLGEDFTYDEAKLDIKFVEVSQTAADPDNKGRYSYALVFKAKNNNSETLNINMLDDFAVSIDGTRYGGDELFSALSAANGAVRYQNYVRYDSELPAGEEMTGFVPFSIPVEKWEDMTITYKPYSDFSNDYIVYNVKKAEVINRTTKEASEDADAGNAENLEADTIDTEENADVVDTEENFDDAASDEFGRLMDELSENFE